MEKNLNLSVRSLGNAGVDLSNSAGRVLIDAFFHGVPSVGGMPVITSDVVDAADLILITHAHYDHFIPDEVAKAARKSGAMVIGPREAVEQIDLDASRLASMDPPERKKPFACVSRRFGPIGVTAFRTSHGRGHNSYLIEMAGVRILHDGDNERTQTYDLTMLGRIDLLLLCPWQGSGAADFVAKTNPGKWLLIHLTDDEIAEHRRGGFLPRLISPAPEGVIALEPGEGMEMLFSG